MDRKDEILQAAEAVFVRYGFAKATLEDVAYEIGLRKTAIYYYFENRDHLFGEMLANKYENLRKEVDAKVLKATTFEKKLEAFFMVKFEQVVEEPAFNELFKISNLPNKHRKLLEKEKVLNVAFEKKALEEIYEVGKKAEVVKDITVNAMYLLISGILYRIMDNDIAKDHKFNIDK
ncbi:MAG: TetR/AcrR family transcriptional regulator, partial [Candidatus Zophobacter franzmannii]|nr:TetR/AcrR family transcriptional regulator [Candidatus Zophobacter franzmannii]